MKSTVIASFFFLAMCHWASAQATLPAEGDHRLLVFDPSTQNYNVENLDENDLIQQRHPAPRPPQHGPVHPTPRPQPRPGGAFHPAPGWHAGWHWNTGYHPSWWHVGIVFPAFVWTDVLAGYYQCTAFNSGLQGFSASGPDQDQAAYGALYACGGPNYEQYGCYIPAGYCQLR